GLVMHWLTTRLGDRRYCLGHRRITTLFSMIRGPGMAQLGPRNSRQRARRHRGITTLWLTTLLGSRWSSSAERDPTTLLFMTTLGCGMEPIGPRSSRLQ